MAGTDYGGDRFLIRTFEGTSASALGQAQDWLYLGMYAYSL